MSVRGLIAGGMSPPATAAAAPACGTVDEDVGSGGGNDWTPNAVEDTTVEDKLTEADDETEDEPEPARVGLGGTDDDGGSGAVGPSLSDTILVAFVAAELPMPPAAPRPDASLLDALRMPKYDVTLMPDDDEDRALIDEEG